jgi:hypothetical protein
VFEEIFLGENGVALFSIWDSFFCGKFEAWLDFKHDFFFFSIRTTQKRAAKVASNSRALFQEKIY